MRYKGGWEKLAIKKVNEFNFNSKSEFHKFILNVSGDNANLDYEGKNVFSWKLPTHVDINHYESGAREERNKEKKDAFLHQDHVQEVPFRLDYGMVGFRSHFNHIPVIIKNLKVKPLISSPRLLNSPIYRKS